MNEVEVPVYRVVTFCVNAASLARCTVYPVSVAPKPVGCCQERLICDGAGEYAVRFAGGAGGQTRLGGGVVGSEYTLT
jgi:hypothetical protein